MGKRYKEEETEIWDAWEQEGIFRMEVGGVTIKVASGCAIETSSHFFFPLDGKSNHFVEIKQSYIVSVSGTSRGKSATSNQPNSHERRCRSVAHAALNE